MPKEEGEVIQILNDIEHDAHKELCFKLYTTSSTHIVVDILKNFMAKLSEEGEEAKKLNFSVSLTKSYKLL